MLRQIDTNACCNRWKDHGEAVVLLCVGLMLCALLLPSVPGGCLVFFTAVSAAVWGARVSVSTYFGALLLPSGFLAASALGLCVSLSWKGGLHIALTNEGMQTAAQTSIRALAAISVTMLFACTVPVPAWIAMLRRLHVPEALLDLILLTYRTLFLIDETRASVLRAQQGRLGYRTLSRAMHSTSMAASALFLKTLAHSQRMERGLAARDYTGKLVVLFPPSKTRRIHLLVAVLIPITLAVCAHFLRALLSPK